MSATKDALRRKKAITLEHFVPEDEAQAARLAFAEQKLKLARFTGEGIEESEAELAAVQDEIRETGVALVIRGVGRLRFEELLREHPPTDEQKEEHSATFDHEAFWPALFAESVEGGLSAADWKADLFDSPDWGPGEVQVLRDKVMAANTGTRVAELGK